MVQGARSSLCKHATQSPAHRAQLLPLSTAYRANLLRSGYQPSPTSQAVSTAGHLWGGRSRQDAGRGRSFGPDFDLAASASRDATCRGPALHGRAPSGRTAAPHIGRRGSPPRHFAHSGIEVPQVADRPVVARRRSGAEVVPQEAASATAEPFSGFTLALQQQGCLRGYTGTGLRQGIQALFRAANIWGTDGRTPRAHDFRHSFAVGSLLRWYQQGADVQSNLPKLAMYMGHVSIVSTAYYLRWIPQLAAAASDRLERHFGHLITGGAA